MRAISTKLRILEEANFSNAAKLWHVLNSTFYSIDGIIEIIKDMIEDAENAERV